MKRLVCFVLVFGVWGGGGAVAQPTGDETPFCQEEARRRATVDTRGLGALYCTTHPVLTRSLTASHRSARPVFYGAVPVAWGAALLRGDGAYGDAYRLTVAQGTTYGIVLGLKHAVGRPRPFVTRALQSRSSHHGVVTEERYRSFPSGHAAISAAIVTSWSLSHPRWYVVGPGAVWAAGVSMSRVYLGVHYPSDVIVGTVLGAGVAVLVHQVRHALTPEGITNEGGGLPVGVRIRF